MQLLGHPSLPSSLSLGCNVQLEVSHGVTQVRLTPYRWPSNKIKKTCVPENTEAHNEEETGLIGLVETLSLYRGQDERGKNNIMKIMKLRKTTVEHIVG